MSESIKSYRFPYSVADTEEGPWIEWNDYSLNLKFTDYTGQECKACFEGVFHFSFFGDSMPGSEKYYYDGVCEVENSELIDQLLKAREIIDEEAKKSKHIVIGFNGRSSFLEVVFQGVQYEKA